MPNLATLLVGLVVFGAFAAVILRALRNKKAGKSESCPGHDLCHPKEK